MSCNMALAAILLLLWLVPGPALGEYSSQALSTFVDTLLAEYDREAPPQAKTSVVLAMDVRHATVNDVASTMQLLADIKMTWVDSRLTWNTSGWSGDSLLVPAERLWTPDIELVNAGGWRAPGAAVLRARLTEDGTVAAVHRLALSVPLTLQLQDWPRDVQRAVFKFASRTHNQNELDLSVNDYAHSLLVESGSWEIVSVVGVLSTWTRGEDGDVPVVAWTVSAARRGAARAAAGGAVLAAAALTLLAAAALPYAQRPPLAAAAAFIAAMWLVTAMSNLPAAASCPRLVRVQCALCVLAGLAALAAAAAGALAVRAAPPPPLLRSLLSELSTHFTAFAHDPESSSGKSGAWAAAAQLLDAVVVTMLVITVVVLCIVQLAA